jgi:hypothetical protein
LQSFQIGILPVGAWRSGILFGFALSAARIFFPLFLLPGFFPISFGDGCFAWSSDGSLLQ